MRYFNLLVGHTIFVTFRLPFFSVRGAGAGAGHPGQGAIEAGSW